MIHIGEAIVRGRRRRVPPLPTTLIAFFPGTVLSAFNSFMIHSDCFRFVFTTPAIEFAKSKGQSTILELLENLLGQAQTQYYQDLLRWMIMVRMARVFARNILFVF